MWMTRAPVFSDIANLIHVKVASSIRDAPQGILRETVFVDKLVSVCDRFIQGHRLQMQLVPHESLRLAKVSWSCDPRMR